MAGDWIKMRTNLWDDPRVGRICDLTGAKEATIVGALYWLWATADQHTEDGCMPGLSMQQIDRKVGLRGFSAALVDVGWLSDDPQGVVIANFEDHNGASAKKRAQTARRVANHRSGNAEETPQGGNGNAPSVNTALAREEKRREEEKATSDDVAGARPAAEPPPLALVETVPKLAKPSLPDCPHQDILALWAEVLPQMPQHNAAQWRGSRCDHLRARWRETAAEKGWTSPQQGIEYLRKLFAYVGRSPFLTGRDHSPGRRPFFAELAWLVEPLNWAKVHEGKYHPEEATA